MPMQLVLDDDEGISIPLDDCTREAWALQCDRAINAGKLEGWLERVAMCFALSLAECLDSDDGYITRTGRCLAIGGAEISWGDD